MGLNEPGPRGFEDINEMHDYNPQLRTRVAYHSESDTIAVTRANGMTTVAVVPGGGIFGGEVAVMNLDGWTWEEATLRSQRRHRVQLPRARRRRRLGGGAGGGGGGGATFEQIKKQRDDRLAEISRTFALARAYAKAGPNKTNDLVLEALVPVVEGRLPLLTNVSGEANIRDAMAFAEREKVKIIIAGATEANLVASLLKEKNIPVILGNVLDDAGTRGRVPRGDLSAGRRAGEGGREGRVLDERRRLRAQPAVPRRDVGCVGHGSQRGA